MKDVFIVGAGPAGSVCAMHAAKMGLDVLLVDKAKFPRHKSCGGALSIRTLDNLGTKAKKGVNCSGDGLTVYGPSWKSSSYHDDDLLSLVVRKHWDHQVLLDAIDAGVEYREGVMVSKISPKKKSITVEMKDGERAKSKYVVIADGTGLRSYKKKLGFTQPYDFMARTVCDEVELDDSVMDSLYDGKRNIQIYFGVVPRGYGWVFPKRGYLNIGIGFSNTSKTEENQFEIFDRFVRELKENNRIPHDYDGSGRMAHPIPFKKPFSPIGVGNVLLAGDAGGFVSPVSGEGLYYGTSAGRIAAETIRDDKEGTLQADLVTTYRDRWMELFGEDVINAGLSLANLVYKSKRRMDLIVKMMIADEGTCKAIAQMIAGVKTYGESRSKIFRRAPLSLIKSIRA